MHHHERLAAGQRRREAVGLIRHVREVVGAHPGRGTRALAPPAEQRVLVVAEDVAGAALAQELHHFVREAELVDGVAGAEELVDVAHAVEGDAQGFVIAVDV